MPKQLLFWSRLAGLALAMTATTFGDELTELRDRLDAIEAQNETLQKELDELKTSEDLLIGRMSELDTDIDKKADSKTEDPKSFSAKWNHGFEETTKDKQFKFHVGGRVQLDGIWLQDNPAAFAGTGPFADQDAVDFRRARLRADGTMYQTIDWCVEIDFVNSANVNPGTVPTETNIDFFPAPTDLWLTFREVPMVGNVRVGNVKEPIGLEHMHSSRYLDFLELLMHRMRFTEDSTTDLLPYCLLTTTGQKNEERGRRVCSRTQPTSSHTALVMESIHGPAASRSFPGMSAKENTWRMWVLRAA